MHAENSITFPIFGMYKRILTIVCMASNSPE